MNSQRRSSLLILGACLLWALDLVVRYPVTLRMSFVSIVFLESLIGLMVVSPVLVKKRAELLLLKKRDWLLAAFIGGIGMSAAGYLQTVCIQKATPGLFSFFQIFQPFFVLLMAGKFLKEKIDSLYAYLGLWVILSAVLMFSVDLELMLSSEIVLSDILIALSTMLIWGLCTIFAKTFLETHSAFILLGLRWVFAFLFSTAILFLEKETIPWELFRSVDFFLRFLFIGAVAGVFSMGLYYSGLKRMPAGKVSFIEISYPAFGMILSAMYTFETLSFLQLLGASSFFTFMIFFLARQDSGAPAVGAA